MLKKITYLLQHISWQGIPWRYIIWLCQHSIHVVYNVNRVLTKRKEPNVTVLELKGFIIIHVLAASYTSKASTIASPENADFFFQLSINSKRYSQVCSSFFCTVERQQKVKVHGRGWYNRPTRGNAFITELEQELVAVNRTILCISWVTIPSLDDDHRRLIWRAVTELPILSHINNAKEALVPVNTAFCSALNPVFLASHYSRPREKIIHVWHRLIQLLQGVPTIGSIAPMADAILAAVPKAQFINPRNKENIEDA